LLLRAAVRLYAHAQLDAFRRIGRGAFRAGLCRRLSGLRPLGVSTSSTKGAIDCTGKRVISFSGDQRRDTGGVPAYRNVSVTSARQAHYHIVDEFTNGQISSGRFYYTLVVHDAESSCNCSRAAR
jgi:hypothetical protein